MKKNLLIIIFLGLITNIMASNDFDKLKKIENLQKKYSEKYIMNKFSDFTKVTGESSENFKNYINIFRKDIHSLMFLKYMDESETKELKLLSTDKEDKFKQKVKLPKYKKALSELIKIKSNNILGAYAGVELISLGLLSGDPSGKYINLDTKMFIEPYYKKFLKILINQKYCYGFLMLSNYLSPKTYFVKKTKSILNLYKNITVTGYKICISSKDKVPFYLIQNMKHAYAYLLALEKLKMLK